MLVPLRSVKTEYPPEWILIPSVLPLSSTPSQPISSSSSKPITSHLQSTEITRFPTRKPIASTTITKKPTPKPSIIETAATKPVTTTKQPQTTTTAPTEKSPVTTQKASIQTTVLMNATTTINDEEILWTTESVTMADEFEETTTVNSEIIETEHVINHATSALPSYTQSATGATTISHINSTAAMSSTESSVASSTEPTGMWFVWKLRFFF